MSSKGIPRVCIAISSSGIDVIGCRFSHAGSSLFPSVFKDSRWRLIRTVKKKRVYLISEHPINWFDRPSSFMCFIGIKWLMHCLYPSEYQTDILKEAREFYRLFLEVDVSDAEMRKIIYQ